MENDYEILYVNDDEEILYEGISASDRIEWNNGWDDWLDDGWNDQWSNCMTTKFDEKK